MSKTEDLEAEWGAVKNGSLEPDPIKIAKAEEEIMRAFNWAWDAGYKAGFQAGKFNAYSKRRKK